MGSREALAQNNCRLSFPPEHARAKNSAKVPVRPPTRSVQLAGWYPRSTRCPRGLPRACPLSPGRAVGSGCRPRGVRPAVCRAGLLARGSTGSSSASSRPACRQPHAASWSVAWPRWCWAAGGFGAGLSWAAFCLLSVWGQGSWFSAAPGSSCHFCHCGHFPRGPSAVPTLGFLVIRHLCSCRFYFALRCWLLWPTELTARDALPVPLALASLWFLRSFPWTKVSVSLDPP